MAKPSKSTKKFQKSHLKRTVDQRRIEHKWKQKVLQGKKKTRKGETDEEVEDAEAKNKVFGSDSVEEFLEQDDLVPEPKKSKKSKSESVSHKDELSQLAEKDPEFYKYLQENDKGLLNFDPEALLDGDDDEDEEPLPKGSAFEPESDDEKGQDGPITVTQKDIRIWKKALDNERSLRALKNVLRAFTAAVHSTESDDPAASNYHYAVTDPDVFNSLLLLTLQSTPAVIKHHIPLTKGENGAKSTPVENKKLKALSPTLRSQLSSLTVLLSSTQEKATLLLILQSIHELLPYFLSYRNLLKEMITAVVKVWASAEDDEARLAAFSFLDSAAKTYQKSLLELVLKTTYGGIVKASRRTNIHTMPSINLMKNSAATLYSIDAVVSYQQGFQFIRQLAIHLRSSITNKTAESYKAIYNWQYAHSLDFWSRALSSHCDPAKEASSGKASPLRDLIHPLVQVTLGAIRLIPTPQYFPLRFYLIRSLLRLSQQTGVYIPVLPLLTEILTSTTISKSGKPSSLRPLDFDHNIRASKAYLGTRAYQAGVCEQLVDLVGEFFVLYSKSVAFPELAIPAIISFRRFTKRSKSIQFNKQVQKLVEKLELNSKFIEQRREKVAFGPRNKTQVAAFLKDLPWQKTPLGAYVVVQREVYAERVRILRESMEEDRLEEQQAKSKKSGYESDEDIDLDDDEDEEVDEEEADEASEDEE